MTRKDYIALAAAFARVDPFSGVSSAEMWIDLRRAIVDALANDNPRFDSGRFVYATLETTRIDPETES